VTNDRTVFVLRQKRANTQGRRPIVSGGGQRRRALVLAADGLMKQGCGGGIVELLRPKDQAEADRLAKDIGLYEAVLVKPRDGAGRRGRPLRAQMRQPFADNAFIVRLLELFRTTLSADAQPSQVAHAQFVRWIQRQCRTKNSEVHEHFALFAPDLLEDELGTRRSTRWWLDQLSGRRKVQR
jgi:hypothetical protein